MWRLLFSSLCALIAATSSAQEISGKLTLTGSMTLDVLDNCTAIADGETGASTSADKNFKSWFASRFEVTGNYLMCHAAYVLSKSGSPTGEVSLAFFADNSGQPGALIVESPAITNSFIPTAITTNLFNIARQMTNGLTYWAAIHFSSTVDQGALTDYYLSHTHFTGSGSDQIYVSDDGLTWADGGGRGHLLFTVRKQE